MNLRGAISLGIMLATFYVCATSVSDLVLSPKIFLLKLFALNAALALFSLTINRARKYLGFDPLFIALLWFPIEYVLIEYAGWGSLFSVSSSGSGLIIGFCSLFGILLGSLVILLSNSLLLLIVKNLARWIVSGKEFLIASGDKDYPLFDEVILERSWYSFPDARAPPLPACNPNK